METREGTVSSQVYQEAVVDVLVSAFWRSVMEKEDEDWVDERTPQECVKNCLEVMNCEIIPRLNNEEEFAMRDVIKSARSVQTFLWGEANGEWGLEEWKRMFRKRFAKLDEVDRSNPHAAVEIKKRLLQTAAVAVALIGVIDKKGVPWDASPDAPPSNLPQYAKSNITKERVEQIHEAVKENARRPEGTISLREFLTVEACPVLYVTTSEGTRKYALLEQAEEYFHFDLDQVYGVLSETSPHWTWDEGRAICDPLGYVILKMTCVGDDIYYAKVAQNVNKVRAEMIAEELGKGELVGKAMAPYPQPDGTWDIEEAVEE